MASYSQKQKEDYKDVVLGVVKKITEKTSIEFRGGYYEKKLMGNSVEEVYVADTRKEYLQMVEMLSDLLLPKFDKAMRENYKTINKEVVKLLKEFEEDKKTQEEYVIAKLKFMRKLFQKLMIFTERVKFFQKKIITEEDFEDATEEE